MYCHENENCISPKHLYAAVTVEDDAQVAYPVRMALYFRCSVQPACLFNYFYTPLILKQKSRKYQLFSAFFHLFLISSAVVPHETVNDHQ